MAHHGTQYRRRWFAIADIFEARGIETIEQLMRSAYKRMTERQLMDLQHAIRPLEPPPCWKDHCRYFTAYAPAHCGAGKIPGRCREFQDYKKRKEQRTCPTCQGRRGAWGNPCQVCGQHGKFIDCPDCGGSGRIVANKQKQAGAR